MTRPCLKGQNHRRASAAFSLLEVMVAVALLAVIIVGLLAMFYQVQRAFRAGTSQGDLMEHGRTVLNLFARELQEAAASRFPGPNTGDRSIVTNLAVVPSVSPAGAALLSATSFQELSNSEQRENFLKDIFFLSRQNDDWIFTAYRLSNAVSGVGTLYRLVARDTTNNPAFLSGALSTATPYNNTNFHRLVDGVVHFYVEAYDHKGLIMTNAWTTAFPGNYGFTNEVMPAYLDIELGVLEPSTFERFKARAESDPDQVTFSTVKGQYLSKKAGRVQLFRQRVPLRGPASDAGY